VNLKGKVMEFQYIGKEITKTCGCGGKKKEDIECDVYFVRMENIGIKLYYFNNALYKQEQMHYKPKNNHTDVEQVVVNTISATLLNRFIDKYNLTLPQPQQEVNLT